jgi:hypothetical protein
MKDRPVLILTFAILLCTPNKVPSRGENHAQAPDVRQSHHPVIIELFTSEGCSTCPPADALLKKLETDHPIDQAEVIALEEHVDYWNHEGWVDPYSATEWTLRQQEYVAKFKLSGPYTPQMVIDGQIQLVGSHKQAAEQAIQDTALRTETEVAIIPEQSVDDSSHRFSVRVRRLMGNTERDTAQVWLAVTEAGIQSEVKGGENAGRTLQHAAILRSLHKIGAAMSNADVSFATTTDVKPKSSWKRDNLRVVVFVQEKKTLRIIGAASAKFANQLAAPNP